MTILALDTMAWDEAGEEILHLFTSDAFIDANLAAPGRFRKVGDLAKPFDRAILS